MEVTTPTRPSPAVERHNEQLATQRIEAALAQAAVTHTSVSVRTIRVVAAAAHAGPDSELARFAATGQCDRQRAERELRTSQIPPAWASALRHHFAAATHLEQERLDGAA